MVIGARDHREGRGRRARRAGQVSVSRAVDGQAIAVIHIHAADVAAINKGRARAVDLGDKAVHAAVMSQVRPDRFGEGGLGRLRGTADISVAGGIDGDPVAIIIRRAPDIAAEVETGAGRGDLGHKGIVQADTIVSQVGSDRHGKTGLGGYGLTCHIGATGSIHGDRLSGVGIGAADIAAVGEARS